MAEKHQTQKLKYACDANVPIILTVRVCVDLSSEQKRRNTVKAYNECNLVLFAVILFPKLEIFGMFFPLVMKRI